MENKIVPVILAGGSGTRLWPLSRKSYPKQFLKLIGNHSLFQQTLLRVKQIEGVKESLIVTSDSHYFICQDQMQELQMEDAKLILEPCSRNTAPAIALAAEELLKKMGPSVTMLVLPADHLIGKPEAFAHFVHSALPLAEKGHFVTFGIVPTSPKTGYGYIQAGEKIEEIGFTVQKFVEKPDEATAKEFFATKQYYWNSGMFLFRAENYLKELRETAPKIHRACMRAYELSHTKADYLRVDEEHFQKCPSDSIDYAVMEKTNRSVIVPLPLPWSDLGCWASVADAGDSDEKNNVIRGNVIMKDCEGCLLSSESEPLVATIGIKNQIVVSTADAVLVASKDYAQEVKEIVSGLKDSNKRLTTHHKQIHRPWGYYETLSESASFRVRLLVINQGQQITFDEPSFLTVIRGNIVIEENQNSTALSPNTSGSISKESHLSNTGEHPAHLLEICIKIEEAGLSPAAQKLEALLRQHVDVG